MSSLPMSQTAGAVSSQGWESLWSQRVLVVRVFVAGGSGVLGRRLVRGFSNAKAKRELGWEPRYPSWRQGFREELA